MFSFNIYKTEYKFIYQINFIKHQTQQWIIQALSYSIKIWSILWRSTLKIMTVILNLAVDQKRIQSKTTIERNWIEELILMLYQYMPYL